MTDPRSSIELQEAVDLAEFYLRLDSARKYGLITGGPQIAVERCEAILKEGRRRGFTPNDAVITNHARTLAGQI